MKYFFILFSTFLFSIAVIIHSTPSEAESNKKQISLHVLSDDLSKIKLTEESLNTYIIGIALMMIDIERWQNEKNAEVYSFYKEEETIKNKSFFNRYFHFFIDFAEADSNSIPPSSICVYGGWLMDRQNGLCPRPPLCEKKQTSAPEKYQCNPLLFGNNLCFEADTAKNRKNATNHCFELSNSSPQIINNLGKELKNKKPQWSQFEQKFNTFLEQRCNKPSSPSKKLCDSINKRVVAIKAASGIKSDPTSGQKKAETPRTDVTAGSRPTSLAPQAVDEKETLQAKGNDSKTSTQNCQPHLLDFNISFIETEAGENTINPVISFEQAQDMICRSHYDKKAMDQKKSFLNNQSKSFNGKSQRSTLYHRELLKQLLNNLNACTFFADEQKISAPQPAETLPYKIELNSGEVGNLIASNGMPLQRRYFGPPSGGQKLNRVIVDRDSLGVTLYSYGIHICQVEFIAPKSGSTSTTTQKSAPGSATR